MASDSALSDLRAELEREQVKLSQQLADMGLDESRSMSYDQNFADSSQVTAERAEVEALAGSLQELLTEVGDALQKMDAGTYGTCEGCGQTISPARLEAKPAARLCIDCASRR